MIVDSSAIVAVMRGEPEQVEFSELLSASPVAQMSAPTLLETSNVLGPELHSRLDRLLAVSAVEIVPFDAEQAYVARAACARFDRRSGSPARLNFGDCFSYSLARVTGEPLLFKGEAFTHTDVTPAR